MADVIFVDGIGGRRYLRRPLLRRLAAAGHVCHYVDHRPSRQSFDAIRAALADRLRAVAGLGSYDLIGYSFGGVLARSALTACPDVPPPRRLVLLASPTHSLVMCRAASRWAPFHWLTGDCGALLASEAAMKAVRFPPVPTTCIYGTRHRAGRLSLAGAAPGDGMVSVDEIEPGRFDDSVPVPCSHPFVPGSRVVLEAIEARLGPGR